MKSETLLLFKRDLWKDQRQLEVREDCIVKSFHSPEEAELEVSALKFLEEELKLACVPHVISADCQCATYPYSKGIRLFNFFVELDGLPPNLQELGQAIKEQFLDDANICQAEIQQALIRFKPNVAPKPYPALEKLRIIIGILSDALDISVNWNVLDDELEFISVKWNEYVSVPFRDATTKNMLLEAEDLWLQNFGSEKDRAEYIAQSIQRNPETWRNTRVINFDFSSCTELSTPEDDPISLNFHERTWAGLPQDSARLSWIGDVDSVRVAITFIIRYYRFGGRKAAYRLLHPSGHRTRFRHDSDIFYFQRLPAVVRSLWSDANLYVPELLKFTELAARALGTMRSPIDLFLEAGLGEKRTYYVDVFPE